MTDKKSTKQGTNIFQILFILGIVFMVFGIFTANAAFLAIGVVFFIIGMAQQDRKPEQNRAPFSELQIDQSKNYKLFVADSDTFLGEISGEQLQFLVDNLEEEFIEDRDYAITRLTIDYLDAKGADPALSSLLKLALGEQGEITIIWKGA